MFRLGLYSINFWDVNSATLPQPSSPIINNSFYPASNAINLINSRKGNVKVLTFRQSDLINYSESNVTWIDNFDSRFERYLSVSGADKLYSILRQDEVDLILVPNYHWPTIYNSSFADLIGSPKFTKPLVSTVTNSIGSLDYQLYELTSGNGVDFSNCSNFNGQDITYFKDVTGKMEFLLHKLFRTPIKNEVPNQSSVLTEEVPSKDFFLERHFGFISLGKNLDPESILSQAIYVNGRLKGDGWYRFYIGARGPSEVYLNLNPTSDPAFISEVITKSSSKFGGATALDSKWKEFFLIIEASPEALRAIEKFELTFCRIELEVMGSGQALVPFIFDDKCTGSACIQKYLLSEANAECRIECELSGFKSESSLKIRLMQTGKDFLRKICLEICQRLEIRGFSIPKFLDSKLSDVKVGRYQVRCISNCDPQGSEPLFIKSIWRNKDGVRYEVNFDLFSTLNSKSPILLPLNASWLEGWRLLTLKRDDIPQIELELEP